MYPIVLGQESNYSVHIWFIQVDME